MTKRHKLTSRAILVSLTIALVAGGAFGLSRRREPDAVPIEAHAIPVEVAEVRHVDRFEQVRTYTGMMRASRQSELSFKRADELIEVMVDRGAHLKRGQSLARLDTRHLLARREQLEAQLAQATAVLSELVQGPRDETIAAQQATVDDLESQVTRLELQLQAAPENCSTTARSRLRSSSGRRTVWYRAARNWRLPNDNSTNCVPVHGRSDWMPNGPP